MQCDCGAARLYLDEISQQNRFLNSSKIFAQKLGTVNMKSNFIDYIGNKVLVSSESIAFAPHSFSGDTFWEIESIHFFWRICKKSSGVILDIGAQIGSYTLLSTRLKNPFIAFEPHPDAFRLLEVNLDLNRENNKAAKVSLENLAVSKSNEGSILKIDTNHQGLSNIGFSQKRMKPNLQVPVQTIQIDQLSIENIFAIKMDIEGGEYDAIQGAIETLIASKPILFIERNTENLLQFGKSISDLDNLLSSLGYKKRYTIGDNALYSTNIRICILKAIISTSLQRKFRTFFGKLRKLISRCDLQIFSQRGYFKLNLPTDK